MTLLLRSGAHYVAVMFQLYDNDSNRWRIWKFYEVSDATVFIDPPVITSNQLPVQNLHEANEGDTKNFIFCVVQQIVPSCIYH